MMTIKTIIGRCPIQEPNGISMAIEKWDKNLSELLIKKGVNLNVQDKEGRAAIHYAINGDKNLIELLIKKAVDLNVQDKEGMAPLHYAAKEGDIRLAELLVKNGARYNMRTKEPYQLAPIHIAISHGKKEVVSYLAEKDINIKKGDKRSICGGVQCSE